MAENESNIEKLDQIQRAQRQNMNACGEAGDKDGMLLHYANVADTYDTFKDLPGWEQGRKNVALALHSAKPGYNARILDCGAATGQTAEEIIKLGYTNIDGLDMSMDMLRVAERKGLFKNIICDTIDGVHNTKIADDSYDVVVCNGTFAPGQMDQTSFPELTRITKSGGFIIFSVSFKYLHEWKLFKNGQLDSEMKKYVSAGKWKKVEQETLNYWEDEQAVYYTVYVA
ncbi:methyltransferase-like protein 27 [Amphiura filiformis]|uniref:methyltransferase-like protein 27 n=1 Tax=Amphiura filiformis TaxID=82378 RepID=UPI003B210EFE